MVITRAHDGEHHNVRIRIASVGMGVPDVGRDEVGDGS